LSGVPEVNYTDLRIYIRHSIRNAQNRDIACLLETGLLTQPWIPNSDSLTVVYYFLNPSDTQKY